MEYKKGYRFEVLKEFELSSKTKIPKGSYLEVTNILNNGLVEFTNNTLKINFILTTSFLDTLFIYIYLSLPETKMPPFESEYNSICPKCGGRAYTSLFTTECENGCK
jgi:hypothetical protein